MAETLRAVATIEKTHGRKGEVVAVPANGLPFLLEAGLSVALVPPELKGPRWRTVLAVTDGRGGQLVSLSGIGGLGEAKKLVGKTVLAHVADLPANLDLIDAEARIGSSVCDARLGALGTIEEVMRGPAHDVWVVRGAYGEVLVPAVDAMVKGVSSHEVVVDLPRGLVSEDEGTKA